jgi:hypothetical protein
MSVVVGVSDKKNLVKIDHNQKVSWFKVTTDEVTKVVETLKDGDNVDIKFNVVNGTQVLTSINKLDASSSEPPVKPKIGEVNNFDIPPTTPTKENNMTQPVYTCSKCGKVLKDDKYEKCYTCNQEERLAAGSNRGTEVNDSIKKQAIGHAVSRSLMSLQSHLTLDNIEEVVTKLYKTYQGLIG